MEFQKRTPFENLIAEHGVEIAGIGCALFAIISILAYTFGAFDDQPKTTNMFNQLTTTYVQDDATTVDSPFYSIQLNLNETLTIRYNDQDMTLPFERKSKTIWTFVLPDQTTTYTIQRIAPTEKKQASNLLITNDAGFSQLLINTQNK